ncbi:uncharacterized protein DNG_06709 [Cephalotrichum gorgonifer]|uniref:Beta-lactamase-related domain-containing protein n=1 Tax=Cephalotrichum gorgonifer TaxID=2041049 RepID=A0AAE8N070_9PEZI|nr:uncharacterized protein DNG_06709 [Cephalotrichum gorgonifer]
MTLRASVIGTLVGLASASLNCRPNGSVVPRPTDLSKSPVFAAALSNLTDALQKAVDGEINGGWPMENSSFSLGVVSISQEDPGVPIWEFHHLSEKNVNGTKEIGRDSQYLIGSISKVFSDLVLLKSGVDLDSPVQEYLPALDGGLIDWKDITLRDLGNHQSGITPNPAGFSEYYYLKSLFELLGFPPIEDTEYPTCGVISLNGPCAEKEYLQELAAGYPVAPPAKTPVYSSIGFSTFILALEKATGKKYAELIEEYITVPLGLKSTAPSPGNTDKAVVPPGDSSWGSDYGLDAPGGGLYSTLSDLSAFLHGILTKSDKILPTATDINAWLKPNSATGGLHSLVGLPWEIYRADELTPEHPHVIDIYAKGGGAYGYRSQVALLDDYGLGLVILTAGPGMAMTPIYEAMLSVLVPAADEAARQQAEGKYTGSFKAEDDVAVEAKMVLDGDSVVIESLTRNGSDIIEGIQEIFNQGLGSIMGFSVSTPRLFPTEIEVRGTVADGQGNYEREVIREDWRMTWGNFSGLPQGELPGVGATGKDCLMWTLADWLHYGREPLDRFVFVRDAGTGEVLGVEVPFLRAGLLRRS